MKNFVLRAAFLCALTMAASCQRSEEVAPATPVAVAPGVTLENGRIVFGTVADFKSLIGTLKKMSETERRAWDVQFGHKSLQHFYDTHEGLITSATNPTYKTQVGDKPYVPDVLFAHILNEDGLYQLGNEVHRIMADEELSIDKSVENLLMGSISDSRVKHYATKVKINGLPTGENQAKGARIEGDMPYIPGVRFGDDDHYGWFVISVSQWAVYQAYAMKIQVREWRGWWFFKSWQNPKEREGADELVLTDCGVYERSLGPGTTPFFGFVNGDYRANDVSDAYAYMGGDWWLDDPFFTRFVIHGYGKIVWRGQTVERWW